MRAAPVVLLLLLPACATASRFPALADPGGCRIERIALEEGAAHFQFDGLSPDGRTLIVGWERGRERGTYLLDLRSGKRTPLPAFNNAASFSPDGRSILGAVYTADRRTEIVEQERATGRTTTHASDPSADFLPSFSPDGRRIYFNSYRTGASDLYAVDLASGTPSRLTTFEGYDAYARPSPDGSRLAFHRQVAPGDYDIVLLDLASGAERMLVAQPGEDAYPAWSPDGRHLIFSSSRGPGPDTDLYVMAAEGGPATALTTGGAGDSYATWARDGRDVYFVSKREGHGVYRLALDDGLRCRR